MSATPRPWQIIVDEDSPLGCIFSPGSETVICTMTPNGQNDLQVKHDAELIVHAVNMLDVMEEAREALVALLPLAQKATTYSHFPGSSFTAISRAKAVLAKLDEGGEQ